METNIRNVKFKKMRILKIKLYRRSLCCIFHSVKKLMALWRSRAFFIKFKSRDLSDRHEASIS